MSMSEAASNREIVMRYLELMRAGAPEIEALFADEVCWVTPQSSPVGRRHEGKQAVLRLMAGGIALYDRTKPMTVEVEALAAEGDRVFVELTIEATTRSGQPYCNHYVFVFRLHDEKIVEVHEHVDTLYAQRMLFDPLGGVLPEGLAPGPRRAAEIGSVG
jgi:ketosteroid isomerase-like protein